MQKWEYLEVVCDWSNDAWRITRVNAETEKNLDQAPILIDYLNQLGNQGWELVSDSIGYYGEMFHAFRYEMDNKDIVKTLNEVSDGIEKLGGEIAFVTSATNKSLFGEGVWLFKTHTKYQRLRFKRQKSS